MRVPTFKRIFKADFPQDQQDFAERLSFLFNNGIEVLYEALNNRLTLKDNFSGTLKDVAITVDANGIPTTSTGFTLDRTGQVLGLQVIMATNNSNNNSYPTSGIFITFDQTTTNVTIRQVTGLRANNSYSLRIFAYQS